MIAGKEIVAEEGTSPENLAKLQAFINNPNSKAQKYFSSYALQQISEKIFTSLETQKSAKRLLRVALSSHLGGKPLYSRSLFRKNTG